MNMSDQELADLTKLAVERCRKAVMSVGQLIDDDAQRSGVLVSCAVDMIQGGMSMLENEGMSPPKAIELVMNAVVKSLGGEASVVTVKSGKQSK
jgi:hypothetical protein